jgi:hypothetical protein
MTTTDDGDTPLRCPSDDTGERRERLELDQSSPPPCPSPLGWSSPPDPELVPPPELVPVPPPVPDPLLVPVPPLDPEPAGDGDAVLVGFAEWVSVASTVGDSLGVGEPLRLNAGWTGVAGSLIRRPASANAPNERTRATRTPPSP